MEESGKGEMGEWKGLKDLIQDDRLEIGMDTLQNNKKKCLEDSEKTSWLTSSLLVTLKPNLWKSTIQLLLKASIASL